MKLHLGLGGRWEQRSRPAGARGLKLVPRHIPWWNTDVAPRRGAWIETDLDLEREEREEVAPRRGAWIETKHWDIHRYSTWHVAPRRGAWIETCYG